MIFCIDCFKDNEIKNRIAAGMKYGFCPICRKSGVLIYDTEIDEYLNGIFDKLISIYTPKSFLSTPFLERQIFIKDELSRNWDIFNGLDSEQIYEIIKVLSPDLYADSPELFDEPVVNAGILDESYLKGNSMLKDNDWDSFVNSLKYDNRFHTNHFNAEILEIFCTYIRKVYKKGSKFYRARFLSKEGLTKEEMSAPPMELTLDGRANSKGIRRLYLSSDEETTLYEIRAGAYDHITVGTFVLKEDIVVVDLDSINKISPFTEDLDCLQYYVNRKVFNKINKEMGKPLRRGDSVLDYLPTQFISDFIQSLKKNGVNEYAGVEYKSVMNKSGFNLAIFDPELFECIEICNYQIDNLRYDKTRL